MLSVRLKEKVSSSALFPSCTITLANIYTITRNLTSIDGMKNKRNIMIVSAFSSCVRNPAFVEVTHSKKEDYGVNELLG
jgi:hypothetical protein